MARAWRLGILGGEGCRGGHRGLLEACEVKRGISGIKGSGREGLRVRSDKVFRVALRWAVRWHVTSLSRCLCMSEIQ